ncbi:MAG: alpha/beta fold hydrolase, partial [Mycobacteriales bacterium]
MCSYRQPGTVLTDHTFTVPLDHDDPSGEQIQLYAREVGAADKIDVAARTLPWLLYLQGGPGHRAPRPIGAESWLGRALKDYRVLLLDQRGVGRSTPANRQTLPHRGDAAAQADYLALFRADSIVRDAEFIRRNLLGEQPWSVLGQSFGGFCAVTYLSLCPDGLREVFLTGGLPGLEATADDVYRATYPRVLGKNAAHYRRYPQDIELAREVAQRLLDGPVPLPGGGLLTVEAFQSLGQLLGSSTGSHRLHYLLEDAFVGVSGSGVSGSARTFSDSFLAQVQQQLSFAAAPLYALLHEACYAQGATATAWSAQRIRPEFSQFDAVTALNGGEPVCFT